MSGMVIEARLLLATIGMAVATAAAPAAKAAPLLWTLDATFDDSPATPTGPALVTGSFTYDPVMNVYDSVMIDVSALVLSGFLGSPFALTLANTTPGGTASEASFSVSRNTFDPTRPFDRYLIVSGGLALSFAAPLTEAGGVIGLSRGSWLLEVSIIDPVFPNSGRFLDGQALASGTVRAMAVSVPVPEPARLGLAVMTLGLLAAAGMRATRPRAAVSRA